MINDIPLDAWVVILRFIDKNNLIKTFNILFVSRAIKIPVKEKLNTFWIVMSQSRYLDTHEQFDEMPDSNEPKEVFRKLKEMGVDDSRAYQLVRQTEARLQDAFILLGWQ